MRGAYVLALLAAVSASGATAQRRSEMETGSIIPIPERARIPVDAKLTEDDRGRVAMEAFARCTVDRKAMQVGKIISLPANRISMDVWGRLADSECLAGGQLAFKPAVLRGALFTELYRRREQDVARGKAWTLPVVPFDDQAPIAADDPDPVNTALLSFAACVVAGDPDHAKVMVLMPNASAAQNAATSALRPSLGRCLTAGNTVKLSKTILEGALGEALYRGSSRPAPQASTELK